MLYSYKTRRFYNPKLNPYDPIPDDAIILTPSEVDLIESGVCVVADPKGRPMVYVPPDDPDRITITQACAIIDDQAEAERAKYLTPGVG